MAIIFTTVINISVNKLKKHVFHKIHIYICDLIYIIENILKEFQELFYSYQGCDGPNTNGNTGGRFSWWEELCALRLLLCVISILLWDGEYGTVTTKDGGGILVGIYYWNI